MAITDATAGAGLPRGSRTKIGGHPINIEEVARLEDGTFAGSVLTMDRAFARLVTMMGVGLVVRGIHLRHDAGARSGTARPRRRIPFSRRNREHLVVLDRHLSVSRTFIVGKQVFARES